MGNRFFDIAFIVPNASKTFPVILQMITSARTMYSANVLTDIHVYCWTELNNLGILLRFYFDNFLPSMLKNLDGYLKTLNAEVIEFERFIGKEHEAILKKLQETSNLQVYGRDHILEGLDEIRKHLSQFHERRRDLRTPARVRVRFRSRNSFVREYTENISCGGMFLRGNTNLPLRSRIKVVLELPDEWGQVTAIAEVVRVEPHGGKTDQSGMGIQFLEFIGNGEKQIQQYLRTYQKQMNPESAATHRMHPKGIEQ